MTDKFNDNLLALVKKNLPEATAAELKTFIEEATRTKSLLQDAEKVIESHKPLLEERKTLLAEKNNVEKKSFDLGAKEKELAAKETALQISAKDQQINALTEIKNNMFTVMQLFVKNPRSIEIMSTFGNDSYSGYTDNSGRYVNDQSVAVSRNTEVEKKEEKED